MVSAKEMRRYALDARDGSVGRVHGICAGTHSPATFV